MVKEKASLQEVKSRKISEHEKKRGIWERLREHGGRWRESKVVGRWWSVQDADERKQNTSKPLSCMYKK